MTAFPARVLPCLISKSTAVAFEFSKRREAEVRLFCGQARGRKMGDGIDCIDFVGTEVLLTRALTELEERRLKDSEKKTRVTKLALEVLSVEQQLRAEKRRGDRLKTGGCRVPEYRPVETVESAWLKERLQRELASMREYYGQLNSENVALKSKIKELRDQVVMFTRLQLCPQRVELADTGKAVKTDISEANSVQRELRKAVTAVADEMDSVEQLRRLHLNHLEALITDNIKLERSLVGLERMCVEESDPPSAGEPVLDWRVTLDTLRAEMELCAGDYDRLLGITKADRLAAVQVQTDP